jgi:hypothetical protein
MLVDRETQTPSSKETRAPSARSLASRRDDAVAGFCGVWMISGLFLDGWAHRHQKPESFFSPWHGILYSGFLASALWMLRIIRMHRIPGTSLRDSLPVGYGLRTIGVGLFGIGAGFDFLWHQLFGIEVNIEALLSPSHLTLVSGGLLMAGGPIASTLARERDHRASWSSTGAAISTIAFVLSLMQFFLMYLSPYDPDTYSADIRREAQATGGRWLANEIRTRGIASIFIFTLTFVVATLWVIRNIEVPRGTFVVLWLIPSVLQTLLASFESARLLIGAGLAAVLAELTWPAVRNHRSRPPVLAGWLAAMMLVMWFGLLAGVRLEGKIGMSVSLWTGVPTFAALLTALIVLGTASPKTPQTT